MFVRLNCHLCLEVQQLIHMEIGKTAAKAIPTFSSIIMNWRKVITVDKISEASCQNPILPCSCHQGIKCRGL